MGSRLFREDVGKLETATFLTIAAISFLFLVAWVI